MNTTINNQQVHESMSMEMSAIKSMGDIAYAINNKDATVTLDFRQTPQIKLDAINRLLIPECTSICKTLDGARAALMNALHNNFWNGIINMDDSSDYELIIGLNRSIWRPVGFVISLREFLKPAGLILVKARA